MGFLFYFIFLLNLILASSKDNLSLYTFLKYCYAHDLKLKREQVLKFAAAVKKEQ